MLTTALVQQLRRQRQQAPRSLKHSTPRTQKHTQPAQSGSLQPAHLVAVVKWRPTVGLSAAMALMVYTLLDLYHFRLAYAVNASFQVLVFLLCTSIALCTAYAVQFKRQRLTRLSHIGFGLVSSIALAYVLLLWRTGVLADLTGIGRYPFAGSSGLAASFAQRFICFGASLNRPHVYTQWGELSAALGAFFILWGWIRNLDFRYFCHRGHPGIVSQPGQADPFRLWLGRSTGRLAQSQHGTGLAPQQSVLLSLEDACQNILVLGAIGSGKTTRAMHPLLLQLLDQGCGGLIFDIKGDFKQAVKQCALATQANRRLRVLGEKGLPLNLIQGLTPELAASFLKSTLVLQNNHTPDTFWLETATQLCSHVLGILSFLPTQYNLSSLYRYLFDAAARAGVQQQIAALSGEEDACAARQLKSYCHYYDTVFSSFDDKIQTGVLATLSQLLTPFQQPALADRFCQNSDFALEQVLEGTIFLVDLPLATWSMGAKVVYNFLKLRFFNVMQQRVTSPAWNQTHPVFLMCDEYQEIVSASSQGLSDLSFWDKARSSKTIGIISTQSVSSFYAAIGRRDVANAILQNFRQKICFRTEDYETLALLNRVAGEVEVTRYTHSEQKGSSTSHSSVLQGNRSRSKTQAESTLARSVLDAQLVRCLQPDQAIALLSIQNHSCDDVLEMLPVFLEN